MQASKHYDKMNCVLLAPDPCSRSSAAHWISESCEPMPVKSINSSFSKGRILGVRPGMAFDLLQ
jgi:hypothetical protein